jgi:hypothetical protein
LAGNAAVVELAEARAAKDYRRDQVDLKEEVARLRRAADVFGNNRANRAGLVGPLSDAKSAAQRILRRATVVSTERDVAQYLLSVSLGDESPDACTFLDRVAALAPRGLLGDTLRNWCAVLMLRLPMPVGDDHRASRVWDDLVHIGGLRLFPRLAELLGQGEGSFGSTIEASASVVNEVLVVTELRDGRWD